MKCTGYYPRCISFFCTESGVRKVGKFLHLTFPDRKIISGMYASGERVEDIASRLGVSHTTIYRELDRGATGALDENQRPVYDEQLADNYGVGTELFDLEAAKKHNIKVISTPAANADSVAELVVGLILDAFRNISRSNKAVLNNQVTRIAPPEMTGYELHGKRLGLIGVGSIAQRVARILRQGFAMSVAGYDPFVTAEQFAERGIEQINDLNSLLEISDV